MYTTINRCKNNIPHLYKIHKKLYNNLDGSKAIYNKLLAQYYGRMEKDNS